MPFLREYKEDILCHFTRIETMVNHIAPSRLVRFGNLVNTNDPKEFFPHRFSISLATIYKMDTLTELELRIHDELCRYKILSFSLSKPYTTPNHQPGYYNARMWAQYSEKHSGCCLIFDKQKFEQTLIKSSQGKAPFKFFGEQIKYELSRDREPVLTPATLLEPVTQESIKTFVRRELSYLLFIKSPHWESENEYRYAIYSESDTECLVDISESLIGVAFGPRCPRSQIEKTMELLEGTSLEFTVIQWLNGTPSYGEVVRSWTEYRIGSLKQRLFVTLAKRAQKNNPNTVYSPKYPEAIVEVLKAMNELDQSQYNEIMGIIAEISNVQKYARAHEEFVTLEAKLRKLQQDEPE